MYIKTVVVVARAEYIRIWTFDRPSVLQKATIVRSRHTSPSKSPLDSSASSTTSSSYCTHRAQQHSKWLYYAAAAIATTHRDWQYCSLFVFLLTSRVCFYILARTSFFRRLLREPNYAAEIRTWSCNITSGRPPSKLACPPSPLSHHRPTTNTTRLSLFPATNTPYRLGIKTAFSHRSFNPPRQAHSIQSHSHLITPHHKAFLSLPSQQAPSTYPPKLPQIQYSTFTLPHTQNASLSTSPFRLATSRPSPARSCSLRSVVATQLHFLRIR